MKTLIAYGTKHGCAEKCANILAKKLDGDVVLCNLKKSKAPNLSDYDNVIIGGSIYIGKIQKHVNSFCENNENVLKTKNLGLFICCADPKEAEMHLNNAYSKLLRDNSTVKMSFGGETNFNKLSWFEKFLVKMANSRKADAPKIDMTKNLSTLSEVSINKFANTISHLNSL